MSGRCIPNTITRLHANLAHLFSAMSKGNHGCSKVFSQPLSFPPSAKWKEWLKDVAINLHWVNPCPVICLLGSVPAQFAKMYLLPVQQKAFRKSLGMPLTFSHSFQSHAGSGRDVLMDNNRWWYEPGFFCPALDEHSFIVQNEVFHSAFLRGSQHTEWYE